MVIRDEPLDLKKKYLIAAPTYITEGKDGYASFVKCKRMMDLDNGKDLGDIIMEFIELPNDREMLEEYKVYAMHKELISQQYIRANMQEKLEKLEQMKGKKTQN